MNIAVIRDGHSDYCVIRQFVSAIFEHHHSVKLKYDDFFEEDVLNISDPINRYIDKSDKKNADYTLYGKHADELKNEVFIVLHTAFNKLSKEKGIFFSNQNVLIVNTDAEKILNKKDSYFEKWAYTLNAVLWLAIEEFYNKMTEMGYAYESLPLILPLILFPSSEILVAACMYDFAKEKENFRSLKAKPDLKQKVYETDSIPRAFRTGKLLEVLSAFVVPDSLQDIYKQIPEVRKFMQILSFSTACAISSEIMQ